MKTPSSRLLPCCTPFPSSPPLLSFVLLSLFLLFFLCPFSGPTSARPNIVSGDPSRPKLSLLLNTPCSAPGNTITASRSRNTTTPSTTKNHHQPSPAPVSTRLLPTPFAILSAPIQYDSLETQLPFCLCRLCVCVLLQSISCIVFTRCEPVTPICLVRLCLASHFLQPRACISCQSAHPLRAPERTCHTSQFHHQRPSPSCSDLIKPTTLLL